MIDINIEDYLYIAKKVGLQFYDRYNGIVDLDDLIQEASIGILVAKEKYNEKMNITFKTIAYKYARNYILKYSYNKFNTIRLPEYIMINKGLFRKAEDRLWVMLEREPTIDEIASEMDIPVEKAKKLQRIDSHVHSLDAENDEGKLIYHAVANVNIERYVEDKFDAEVLNKCVATLSPRQKEILMYRYKLDMKQVQVGNLLGISRKTVFTNESRALGILRQNIELKQLILN